MALDLEIALQSDSAAIAEFVTAHPEGQIEHTFEGSRLMDHASGSRWQAGTLVARESRSIVGVMPYALARHRILPLSACRSSGGPLADASRGVDVARAMLGWLVDMAQDAGCTRVELRLHFPETIAGEAVPSAEPMLELTRSLGFSRRPPPRFGTYWIPLADDDQILGAMRSNARRDLRKAWRDGVTADCRTSPDALRDFHRAYLEMYRRKSLAIRPDAYFFEGVRACLEAGTSAVFVSSHEGQPCNMALVSLTGRPSYWLGATTARGLTRGIPPAGQALHFEVMRQLRSRGLARYDLGGSPGPLPEAGHLNYGVWKFKYALGGQWVVYLDEFERVLSPIADRLLRAGYRASRLLTRRG